MAKITVSYYSLFFLFFFHSVALLADCKDTKIVSGQYGVVFFGGYKSTIADLESWEQLTNTGAVVYIGEHFKSSKSDYINAVNAGREQLEACERMIALSASTFKRLIGMEQKWLIAGHSSGAALAIELYKKIKTLDAKIKLATLDGFVPPKYLMNNNTKCWRSVSRINNLKSYNYDSQNNCNQLEELESPECNNSMCLHYALINKASAKNKTDFKNYSTVGYKALDPELVWVEF